MSFAVDIALQLPLASGIVWLANGLWPWFRGLRTSPEKAFVAGSLLLGTWAVLDWAFLHTTDPGYADLAILISKVRITVFALAWLAFVYFGRWLSRTRSWVDYLLVLPVLGSIGLSWTVITTGVDLASGVPRLIRDPGWYAVFALQTAAYLVLGFGYIGWNLRRAKFSTPVTRNKLIAIFAALVITMAVWLPTNAFASLTQTGGFPALSSVLIVPGILVLAFLAPESTRDLLAIIRRLTVTPARPFAAIWFHNSGQPLAQVVLPGESSPDAATLADLSRAIDHVLVEGLQSNPGALRQLEHEKHSFVFEKGRYLTLVVLVRGNPSEGLRSELRYTVQGFERVHGPRLESWDSASDLAEQALNALEEVLNPQIL